MKLLAYLIMTVAFTAGALATATAYLVPIGNDSSTDDTFQTTNDAGNTDYLRLASPAGSFDPKNEALAQRVAALHEQLDELKAQLDGEDEPANQTEAPAIEQTDQQTDQQADAEITGDPDIAVDETAAPEADQPADQPADQTIAAQETAAIPADFKTGEQLAAALDERKPIGRVGDPLTPDLLALLRETSDQAQDARIGSRAYVRVSSFSLLRWPYAWVFGLSVIALAASAFIVKASSRASAEEDVHTDATSGDAALAFAEIERLINTLIDELPDIHSEPVRVGKMVDLLGEAQREYIPAFAGDRETLIARMGLGGYAALMDRFAALERQINRAWSAAADDHEPEAAASLELAAAMLPLVRERLPSTRPPAGGLADARRINNDDGDLPIVGAPLSPNDTPLRPM